VRADDTPGKAETSLRHLSPIRTTAVPWLALVLGVIAIGAISFLAHRTHSSRHAELTLLTVKVELNQLQNAPFRANAQTGGSPALARSLMRSGKGLINGQLAELRRQPSPPTTLHSMQAPLRANFATLDHIYALGITPAGYDGRADRLSAAAARSAGTIEAMLDAAGRDYERRAVRAQNQAGVGSATVILLLLLAFVVYYRRAAQARAVAADFARENERLLVASRREALTDALTGLGNRRALVNDLEAELPRADDESPRVLALFDLDGFKQYNDSFGHPAGDALLARLAERLKAVTDGLGSVYRMGGDEFCLLARVEPGGGDELVLLAAGALTDTGDAFEIGCSHGLARIPGEADSPQVALRLADQRMYAQKAQQPSLGREGRELLLQVIAERGAGLGDHLSGVAQLAGHTAERLGLPEHEVRRIPLAAELHDVGKTAIPDTTLNKPSALSDEEWEFMRRHTVIGERIIRAAPLLAHAAELVRCSHERFDGGGYPDALRRDQIPLGASIIAVCDAFDAMVSNRPYRTAMSLADAVIELRSCAGTQFHPGVVDAFCALVAEPSLPAAHVA
jgi:diguanylate cyclase (GGDEF)-like protein